MSQWLYDRSERGFFDPAQTHLSEFHAGSIDLYPTNTNNNVSDQ